MREFSSRHFEAVIGPIVDPTPDVMRRYPVSAYFSDRRKAQFSTGRLYAERAIKNIGGSLTEVGIGDDRAPIWPDGIRGSISHTDSMCIAIVGKAAVVQAVGIDVELADAVTSDLVPLIVGPGDADLSSDPTLVFSAKEAYYKIWSPIAGEFLEFSDLEVRSLTESRVAVSLVGKQACPPRLQKLIGYHLRVGRHLIVGLALPSGSAPNDPVDDALADLFAGLQCDC